MAGKRDGVPWWGPKWATETEHGAALVVEAEGPTGWGWGVLEARLTAARRYQGSREWSSADGVLADWCVPLVYRPARILRDPGEVEPGPYAWDVSAVEPGGEVWTHGRRADPRKVGEWVEALAAIRRRLERLSKVAGPLARGDLLGALSRVASVLDVRSVLVASGVGRLKCYEGRPWGGAEVEAEGPSGLLWRLESAGHAFLEAHGLTREGKRAPAEPVAEPGS